MAATQEAMHLTCELEACQKFSLYNTQHMKYKLMLILLI